MGTRKGRAKAFDTSRPSASKQHKEEKHGQNQHRGDKEDQRVVLPTWKYWYRK